MPKAGKGIHIQNFDYHIRLRVHCKRPSSVVNVKCTAELVVEKVYRLPDFIIHKLNTYLTQDSFFLCQTILKSWTEWGSKLPMGPKQLWSQTNEGVELIVITPKSSLRPCQNQFPLKQEATVCIRPVSNSLLKAGFIMPFETSPVCTPIFPV